MFDYYHPVSFFLFVTLIIVTTLLFAHPAFLAITFTASVFHALFCKGFNGAKSGLASAAFTAALFAVINPLINHRGGTVLFYIRYNAVTLESFAAGLCAGIMFASVMLWFISFSKALTSERLLFVFGKASPAAALVISMSIRLIPRLKTQITEISNAQKTIGRDISSGKLALRCKNGLKILSALISWALENSIETADSMNARGYGSGRSGSFNPFSFNKKDFIFVSALFLCFGALLFFYVRGYAYVEFFPRFKTTALSDTLPMTFTYLLFCFAPTIFNAAEMMYWKLSK